MVEMVYRNNVAGADTVGVASTEPKAKGQALKLSALKCLPLKQI